MALLTPQMGMSFLIILEVFKFVGRKYKCAPYFRALCDLANVSL